MREFRLILWIPIILMVSCSETNVEKLLNEANNEIKINYTKAKDLLDQIENPYLLKTKEMALYTYLECRIADSLKTDLPLLSDIQVATNWYINGKDDLITTRMLLFLGRSLAYNEEEHSAMSHYLKALTLAKKNNYFNMAGYINSYIGDLYTENTDMFVAVTKYGEAAEYFNLAENYKSSAYAYRDMGRSWSLVDSLSLAMESFRKAEKIAIKLNNDRVKSHILNGIGNVYSLMGEFDKAENILIEALKLDSIESIPTANALIDIYVMQQNYNKAKHLLDSLSKTPLTDDDQNTLNYNCYRLYESQYKYEEALVYLEKVFDYYQFSYINNSKISVHELEKKYNNILLLNENDQLRIKTQFYLIVLIFLLALVLSLVVIVQYRTIKANKLIFKRDKEISDLDKEIQLLQAKYYHIKDELKQTLSVKDGEYREKENIINTLSNRLKDLRKKRLHSSDIGKKLKSLASVVKPKTSKSLITQRMWDLIEREVKDVYPEFELKIAELSKDSLNESQWQYCCLILFNLDGNEEGILLNINPHSARQRRLRLREKLGIPPLKEGDSDNLYEYFIENFLRV